MFSFLAPTFRNGSLLYRLVLATDAVNLNGTFPRTPQYVEECQYPEALDRNIIISQYNEQQTYRDAKGFVREFNARDAIGDGRVAAIGAKAPIISKFSLRGPDFIVVGK
ncbi:hypothetical protein REPUB_Repub13aG0270500 [Reevesia pubescens]